MKKQTGFSLIEIFVSLAIGLILFAGVLSIFVGIRSTTSETASYGNIQETGRFVISLFTDDLMRQGYWGGMTMPLSRSSLIAAPPAAPAGDCIGGGINNRTFPLALGNFRTLWGMTATTANAMGCITNAKVGSDILQLKRVVAQPVVGLNADRYYLVSNRTIGQIIDGSDPIPVINNGQNREYQHHVYYVSEDTFGGPSAPVTVPVLNLKMLVNTLDDEPIVDGVEMIRFMYGVDDDLDGVVDAYISANNMTQSFWDNESSSRILAVKMYVLVRDITPDSKYTNNLTYLLGDTTFTAPNDNYRRMVFSSTVTLFNGDVDIWN